MEKAYQIDAARCFGLKEGEQDPDAPDSVWVAVVSRDRDECEGPEAKTDSMRYVSAKGGGVASSIDRSSGPFIDSGQKPPVGGGNNPGNSGFVSADHYLRQIAASKFQKSKGEATSFITFHRVRRADLI